MQQNTQPSKRTKFQGSQFATVVCWNPKKGKFLMINETKDRGWWLPGGHVDPGETFKAAAVRECKEEAEIDIELKGILSIEHILTADNIFEMYVVFYAEPINAE